MLSVRGDLGRLIRDISTPKVTKVLTEIDNEIGEIAKKLSEDAANSAPILTGALRNSLSGAAVHAGLLHWDMPVDLDGVPYVWRQNFEHKTKRYYITKNVRVAEMSFAPRLQKVVDSAW